ncbi:MAG TPA: hypothetical protein VNT26_13340, partial [Candidatus Sulfotelmatobacter sp.]|nr:hypothetical protein [Candidatus Sulfotelmatobacter sp.]
AGQTNTTLALGPVGRTNSGLYSVVVSNELGNWIAFQATVRALLPAILEPPQFTEHGTIRLRLRDADGALPYDPSQVQVQWRTNLPTATDQQWQPLTNGLLFNDGFLVLEDTNVVGQPTRFYRIQQQ